MLSNIITSTRMRYAFAGAALGSVFCSTALAYDALVLNGGSETLAGLVRNNPAHICMALVPLILGVTFFKIGESRARLDRELILRKEAERSLEFNAFHDSLTALGNRHALERAILEIIDRGIGGDNRPAMMLLDLDKFKFINDTMGHNVGDAMLLAVAERLRHAMGPGQRIFRLGGDEFVILWDGAPTTKVINAFCGALTHLISFPFDIDGVKLISGGSVGVTWIERGDCDMSDALRRADLALYRAKEIPGSHYTLYDRAIAYEAEQRMRMENDLRLALGEGQFFLEYQPIVNLATNGVRGLEALIRWRRGEQVVPPDMFIPIAEKSGLIIPIGKWVLTEACRQAVRWPRDIGISVNVAGEQFKDNCFVEFVRETLERTRLDPHRLTLEVTESLFGVDVGLVRESLAQLRSSGVRIALDDFGTGFSSINHLRTFPLDMLKIDRSFTQMLLDNQREAELVEIMMRLSETFGMATTVEGVETEGQLDFIRRAGAGDVQGFLISRPVSSDMVLPLIAAKRVRVGMAQTGHGASLHRLHA
jgi:diguanylate cyclase (GGDEF)-like protein